MQKLICWFRGHQGTLGVNPKNNNTEARCHRCGTWFVAKGVRRGTGTKVQYYG